MGDEAIRDLAERLRAEHEAAADLAARGNSAPSAPRIAEVERELARANSRIDLLQTEMISLTPQSVAGWVIKASVLAERLRKDCTSPGSVYAAARILEADARQLLEQR